MNENISKGKVEKPSRGDDCDKKELRRERPFNK